MEIKLVEVVFREGQHEFQTELYQADDIKHKRVYYDSKEDFNKKYDKLTEDMVGGVLGIPDNYWRNEKVDAKGYFIFCSYIDRHDELKFIAFQNRKMYVTNKGTTVDVVE